MQTLAEQIVNEYKRDWILAVEKRVEKKIEKKKMRETARRMLLNNFTAEQVKTITGLSEKEIKRMVSGRVVEW